MATTTKSQVLSFVTCANDSTVLRRRLLASACLAGCEYAQAVHVSAPSAAAAFNVEMAHLPAAEWLVWAHQDVFLPPDWDQRFIAAIRDAEVQFSQLAVVGVYGVAGAGAAARRAGHVMDRGTVLQETIPLPCRVDSIDELLFAVRVDTGLRLDPALGFDFYGTDLALSARESGFDTAVVDAYCEHWSNTPREIAALPVATRVIRSGEVFERKWAHRLRVSILISSTVSMISLTLPVRAAATTWLTFRCQTPLVFSA
jgi:hypothetical protein